MGGGGGEAREVEEGLERRERLLEPWRNGVVSLRDWRRDIAGFGRRMWVGFGFCQSLWIGFWVCLGVGIPCPCGGLGSPCPSFMNLGK